MESEEAGLVEVKVEPSEVLTVVVDPSMVKSEPPNTEGAQDISPFTSNKVSPSKLKHSYKNSL